MADTADAIYAIGQCLRAAHPNDPDVAKRFTEEQTGGALVRGAHPTGEGKIVKSATLAGIKVDAKPYEEAIANLEQSRYPSYKSHAALGNLLLLADRPAEAKTAFETAYSLAKETNLAVATENLARAMKAEDGTIGRANSWVLSIRPREQ
jgi:hypothetical protein